jgi:hypothetical protein
MNIGQAVTEAIIALAKEHPVIELEIRTYANLRHGGPKVLGSRFEVRKPGDEGYTDGQHASIGSTKILVRRDVPDLHARVGSELIRLPYPEDFHF